MKIKLLIKITILLLALNLFNGCGTYGKLYLPDDPEANQDDNDIIN